MPNKCIWDSHIAAGHHMTTTSNRGKQSYNEGNRVITRKFANKLEYCFKGYDDLRVSTGKYSVHCYLLFLNYCVLKHDLKSNI